MNSEEDDTASRFKQLEDFCASDDLSIDELRRMTEGLSLNFRHGSSFLHRACLNKNVTLEIAEHLFKTHHHALHNNMSIKIDEEKVVSAFPLHLACYNKDCPNEVIQFLLERNNITNTKQLILERICYMNFDWGSTDVHLVDDNEYGGTPLHFYLSRTSNVDMNIVKELVVNSRVLLYTDGKTNSSPLHILMHNPKIGELYEVVKYLVETNPDSLRKTDIYDQTPLNVACINGNMTARTIELLLRVYPDSIYQPNNCSWLPIHNLCGEETKGIDDEVAIDILKLLLDAYPDSVTRTTDFDSTEELPLHKAADNKSPAFCKVLVDAYPESVRRVSNEGYLPFHHACGEGRPETVEYLFGLYSESINIRNNYGDLPIHWACTLPNKNTSAIIKFLVTQDPECVSKPVVSDRGDDNNHRQGNDTLPLHIICSRWDKSNITELLYDLYPEAILIRNRLGKLPIDLVRENLDGLGVDPEKGTVYNVEYQQSMQYGLIPFLQTQMNYARQAQDRNVMMTPDNTGYLPLHNAIREHATLGSIKLLVKGYPDAVNVVPDGSGMHPLDIACEVSTVGVVKYLAELVPDRLNTCDVNKNYPLHHACWGGNYEVILYLLERPMSLASVSERNVGGMLPVHLLCNFVSCHGYDVPEYTEIIWRLLTAYPETVLNW